MWLTWLQVVGGGDWSLARLIIEVGFICGSTGALVQTIRTTNAGLAKMTKDVNAELAKIAKELEKIREALADHGTRIRLVEDFRVRTEGRRGLRSTE